MVKRRRYDTVALVSEIKRERRNAIVWALAASAVLVGILAIIFVIQRTPDDQLTPVTEVHPAVATPAQAVAEPAKAAVAVEAVAAAPVEADGVKPAAVKPARPEKSKPATVQVSMPRSARVSVNGKPHKGGKPLTLAAGEHEFRVKSGGRTMTAKVTLASGGKYELKMGRRKLDMKQLN